MSWSFRVMEHACEEEGCSLLCVLACGLEVDCVDLYLIHWPGPGYWAMGRSKKLIAEHGVEYYFNKSPAWGGCRSPTSRMAVCGKVELSHLFLRIVRSV